MPEMLQVKNKKTGKTEWQTPLNARDLTTHLPDTWELVGTSGSAPQEFREGESTDSEIIDLLDNRRVKDNIRVVGESQVSNTEHLDPTGALAVGGDEEKIVKDEGTDDITGEQEDDDDEANDGAAGTNEAAPNGIVRSSSGELVDDELVTATKSLNKQQLVAYGAKNYNLNLDGRKKEDDLRLAIYDAAEKSK